MTDDICSKVATGTWEARMQEMASSVTFKTDSGKFQVTRDGIISAMREFDLRFRPREEESGTLYAVQEDGKRYPPKRILELTTGAPRNKFYGGEPANRVFRRLGFEVLRVAKNYRGWKTAKEIAAEKIRLKLPVPVVTKLVEELFRRNWVHMHEDYSKLEDSEYPGVYVLAYRNEDLRAKRVRESQVYYVGMSHAGVRKRIKQFIMGLEDGGHHSGAKKFCFKEAHETPYLSLPNKKTFFCSSISIPCISLKRNRSPLDLQKMGIVAQLECYVLARIKEKTRQEPWLNTK